jgi:hypothetical protein
MTSPQGLLCVSNQKLKLSLFLTGLLLFLLEILLLITLCLPLRKILFTITVVAISNVLIKEALRGLLAARLLLL